MWTKLLLLWGFVGDQIAARYVTRHHHPLAFPAFLEDEIAFPRQGDVPSLDPLFGPWWMPEFDVLADFPPVTDVPRVEVHCDRSKLTLLVEKRTFSRRLSREELLLGDGCYSNAELPNQFLFSYSVDQCGTSQLIQDGLTVFTNSLHLNFKRSLPNWFQTPDIHISCMPARSFNPRPARISSENKRFDIRTMSPSWSNAEESHIYRRGHVVHLQVSGRIRPDQQLFIQSCFVSASPESQTRPRHAVILNKGCATSLGSHPVAQFVASDEADVVRFSLNTSHLISELYIHCSLVVSDLGVSCGAKSCNYNATESRWEELTGDAAVCDCCSSKCNGQNAQDAKALVSVGPLVIVDDDGPEPTNDTRPNSTLPNPSDGAPDAVVSRTSTSGGRFWPAGVVAVRQEPGARRTLWLPGAEDDVGRMETPPPRDDLSNDVPEPRAAGREPPLTLLTDEMEALILNDLQSNASALDWNLLTMFEGWPLPPQPDVVLVAEELDRNPRFRESTGTEAGRDVGPPLPAEISVDFVLLVEKPEDAEIAEESRRKRRFPDEVHGVEEDERNLMEEEGEPMIRSKVEFSRGSDGSRKLSYEEEVMKPREDGADGKRSEREVRTSAPRLKALRSIFMRLLRKMDKAE